MQLWQLDIVSGVPLADGRAAKLVTGIDDHSRFVVISAVVMVPACRNPGAAAAGLPVRLGSAPHRDVAAFESRASGYEQAGSAACTTRSPAGRPCWHPAAIWCSLTLFSPWLIPTLLAGRRGKARTRRRASRLLAAATGPAKSPHTSSRENVDRSTRMAVKPPAASRAAAAARPARLPRCPWPSAGTPNVLPSTPSVAQLAAERSFPLLARSYTPTASAEGSFVSTMPAREALEAPTGTAPSRPPSNGSRGRPPYG
jgi:hypothetical protein